MLLKIIVFALHFFFFGLTGVLFLLKFHKKEKKFVMLTVVILWLVFGTIDFVLELNSVISTFV
jgi:hypothetical protein